MKIGAVVSFPARLDKSVLVSRIRQMEDAGVDSLWTWTHEPFAHAGYLASNTTKAKIAYGVLDPYTRNPVVLAEGAASLDALSGHRAIMILGFGWLPWMKLYGVEERDPIGDMEDCVNAIHELLAGKEVKMETKRFRLKNAHIRKPPKGKVPLYLAAKQRKGLQLARRVADGVMVGGYSTTASIKWVANQPRETSTLPSDFQICCYLPLHVTDNPDKAHEEMKKEVALYLAGPDGELYVKRGGFDSKILPRIRKATKVQEYLAQGRDPVLAYRVGDPSEAARLVSNEWVDACSLIGTIDHCIERLDEYKEAGLTCAVLDFQEAFDSNIQYFPEIIRRTERL